MKNNASENFTRGTEYLRHFAAMFAASVRVLLVGSTVLGILIGSLWFQLQQPTETRWNVYQYIKAGILTDALSNRQASFDLDDGQGRRIIKTSIAYETLKERKFQHRTWGYVLFQLFVKWIFFSSISVIITIVIVSQYGKKMREKVHLRGAQLLQKNDVLGKKKGEIIPIFLLGFIAGTVVVGLVIDSDGRTFYTDYLWSGFLLTFGLMESFSPDGSLGLAWFYQPEPGFRDALEMYTWMKTNVFCGQAYGLILLWHSALIIASTFGIYHGKKYLKSKKIPKKDERFTVSGIPLDSGTETKSFGFFGSPGSGKTTTVFELLDQIREKKQRAILHDPKGEFIEYFYRKGKDYILNPMDKRFPGWNIWNEIKDPTHYSSLASSLIPTLDPKSKEWTDGAATIFQELLKRLAQLDMKTNAELWEKITTSTVEDLNRFLEGSPAQRLCDPKAEAQSAGYLGSVTTNTKAWEYLVGKEGNPPLCIRDFIRNDDHDSWIFLSSRAEQREAFAPLVSLWIEIASTSLLSLEPDRKRRVWYVIDELPSLQKLPSLTKLLAEGRGFGACCILGIQSVAQTRSIYGRDGSDALLAMPQTTLVLKTDEPDSASWLSRALGQQELEEKRQSTSMGANSMRDGVSISEANATKNLVLPSEIMGLDPLHGYLKSLQFGASIVQVDFEWKKDRKKIAKYYKPV